MKAAYFKHELAVAAPHLRVVRDGAGGSRCAPVLRSTAPERRSHRSPRAQATEEAPSAPRSHAPQPRRPRPRRSLRFYQTVFGVKEYYRDAVQRQVLGPGPHDVLAFERNARKAGKVGGITHFGSGEAAAGRAAASSEAALAAGRSPAARGSSSPGYPFAYIADPDGYEGEVCTSSRTAIARATGPAALPSVQYRRRVRWDSTSWTTLGVSPQAGIAAASGRCVIAGLLAWRAFRLNRSGSRRPPRLSLDD